eukprot:4866909-Alexandrium_andersonii.AAC.1
MGYGSGLDGCRPQPQASPHWPLGAWATNIGALLGRIPAPARAGTRRHHEVTIPKATPVLVSCLHQPPAASSRRPGGARTKGS